MKICDATQQRLAEEGAEILDHDAEAARHVEGCADCTRFLADLARVETALGELPAYDASDALVADTLRAVRAAGPVETRPARPSPRRLRLAGALAASVVIVATIGLTHNLIQSPDYQTTYGDSVADAPAPVAEVPGGKTDQSAGSVSGTAGVVDEGAETAKQAHRAITEDTQPAEYVMTAMPEPEPVDMAEAPSHEEDGRLAAEKSMANAPLDKVEDERRRKEVEQFARINKNIAQLERRLSVKNQRDDGDGEAPAAPPQGAKSKTEESVRGVSDAEPEQPEYFSSSLESNELAVVGGAELFSMAPDASAPSGNAAKRAYGEDEPVSALGLDDLATGRLHSEADQEAGQGKLLSKDRAVRESQVERDAIGEIVPEPEIKLDYLLKPISPWALADREARQGKVSAEDQTTAETQAIYDELYKSVAPTETFEYGGFYRQNRTFDPEAAQRRAKAFLESYDSVERLAFQSATGYWANTYIPGDSAMRLLASRLRGWDRASLGAELRLEQAAQQVAQPFDAPTDAALAVYLHADTGAIQGPTRLRVQVGIKGAERHGGHRPAMNIGLVVDARDLSDDRIGARVRALITALVRIRQPGDKFSLTAAGPAGGMLVAPEQFRHGPLRVAMEQLYGDATAAGADSVALIDAVALASESVRQGDDPNAVLGASLVLLATGASIAGDLDALERLAHAGAVGGVPLSVVRLSDRADLDDIDRLVAAGQGNRRILDTADQADALIDRELHSASRAVARAVRLRIRLAPGVKLVEVLGSRRLEVVQADRVREAELALDQRLARNLGIEADRGDDEEGIQIVIPSFYAGDAHVILLDVVADGPGPIADVTARYKDIVYLRNGVASSRLTIAAGPAARGPLERNVLKNLAAWELSRATRRASDTLRAGNVREVGALVASLRQLIYGLRLEVASWSTDAELMADEAMLDDYLSLLESSADPVLRGYLADSLRITAYKKLQPSTE